MKNKKVFRSFTVLLAALIIICLLYTSDAADEL